MNICESGKFVPSMKTGDCVQYFTVTFFLHSFFFYDIFCYSVFVNPSFRVCIIPLYACIDDIEEP